MASLKYIKNYLKERTSQFNSISEAISWSIQSGLLKNRDSAKISIPDQLIKDGTLYKWRTDLLSTERYWPEWYSGISLKFLSVKGPKLLLLAGTDRLDTELTRGTIFHLF